MCVRVRISYDGRLHHYRKLCGDEGAPGRYERDVEVPAARFDEWEARWAAFMLVQVQLAALYSPLNPQEE